MKIALFRLNGGEATASYWTEPRGAIGVQISILNAEKQAEITFGPQRFVDLERAKFWIERQIAPYGFQRGEYDMLNLSPATAKRR